MKNIKLYIWLALALFVVSCAQEEGSLYENPDGKSQVSFASDKLIAEMTADDGNQIQIQVNRNSSKGALDVPIKFTSASTLFTMADTVAHFTDGNAAANLTISFPGATGLSPGVTYSLRVRIIDSTMISVSGIREQTLTLSRSLTWVKVGDGIFESIDIEGYEWSQTLERAQEVPTLYRFPSLYNSGFHILFTMEDDGKITAIPRQRIGGADHSTYGPFFITMPRAAYPQPYKEGNVIHFWCELVVDAGTFGYMEEVFTIGGVKPEPEPDYSAGIEFTGRYTNTAGKDYALAEVTLGADVAYAQVALVPGEWDNSIVNKIVSGAIESEKINADGPVSMLCPKQGVYTYVVVTFSSNNEAKKAAYVTFVFPPTDISIDSFCGDFSLVGYSLFEDDLAVEMDVKIKKGDKENTLIITGIDYAKSILATFDPATSYMSIVPQELADYGVYDITLYTFLPSGNYSTSAAMDFTVNMNGVLSLSSKSVAIGYLLYSEYADSWVDGYYDLEFTPASTRSTIANKATPSKLTPYSEIPTGIIEKVSALKREEVIMRGSMTIPRKAMSISPLKNPDVKLLDSF